MRHLLIYLVLFGCWAGCREAAPPVLDERTMQAVLTDIHLADAWVEKGGGTLMERTMLREGVYDEVLARYDLDRETFYRSYRYYLEEAVTLDSIYVRMVRDLEAMEMDLQRERMQNKN